MTTPRVELRTVAVALLASLLLWNLPFGGLVLYPFKLLATWLHEMSHVFVMIITGLGFGGVKIYRDTSGITYQGAHGNAVQSALVAAAGYMGTPLWGAVLLVVTPTAKAARRAMLVLAVLMIWTAIFVVIPADGSNFGMVAVLALAGVIGLCALVLPGRWRVAVAHFIAAQSCVNALLDIRVLLRPLQVINGDDTSQASDATAMSLATFGSSAHWGVYTWSLVWLAWSLIVLYVALTLSGSQALATVVRRVRARASLRGGSDRDGRRRNPATAPDETAPTAPTDTAGS